MQRPRVPDVFGLPQKAILQLADVFAHAVVQRIPKDVFKRKKSRSRPKKMENPMVLDTSAIIDGRIAEVGRLGFLSGHVLVPDFILLELKHVADSQDLLKRARGRKGLELLEQMKKIKGIKLVIVESKNEDKKENDEKLLKFAKQAKGRLVTCDFNLNKKASVEGVKVVNINELANALKTVALPGEEMSVKIVAIGKGKEQGVGYLQDGTMIVVEDGKEKVGKEVKIHVSRVLQTPAGRMVFGKLKV